MCHPAVMYEGAVEPSVYLKIKDTEAIQNKIVPYIPSTCANLLLPIPSSEVVAISWATVLKITAVFFAVNSVFADFFAFLHFSKNKSHFFMKHI